MNGKDGVAGQGIDIPCFTYGLAQKDSFSQLFCLRKIHLSRGHLLLEVIQDIHIFSPYPPQIIVDRGIDSGINHLLDGDHGSCQILNHVFFDSILHQCIDGPARADQGKQDQEGVP